MKIPPEINNMRRSLMRRLTKNVGEAKIRTIQRESPQIKKVLICRPNHRLGNLLLITPLVQEVTNTFPDCQIDLFVKGRIAAQIFKNYENIDQIIQLPDKPFSNIIKYIYAWIRVRRRKYDWAINANLGSSSGKLAVLIANSPNKFFGEYNEQYDLTYWDYDHAAKKQIYNLREYMLGIHAIENTHKIPLLNLRLDEKEISIGKNKIERITNNNKKTISLFTNATGEKCFSETWWCEFYIKMQDAFPDCNIVEVLPISNISKLVFQAPTFYSKDIREMGALIANTDLFISADCGVMHLASAVGTPTIGLFSVTSEKQYGPYNLNSRAININLVSDREIFELIKQILVLSKH